MSIIDALKKSVIEGFESNLTVPDILLGLTVSLAAGLFILLVYRLSVRQVSFNRGFGITLLLVCSISAMIVLTITSNLALSLGMVGALSIVRFRTAIKDAMDTAFMFWAVAAGITSGAGFYLLSLVGCLFIGVVCALSLVLCEQASRPFLLVVRSEHSGVMDGVEQLLKQGGVRYKLSAVLESPKGAEITYELGFARKNYPAVRQLRELAGVTAVSLVDCRKS